MADQEHAWPLIVFTVIGPTSVGCLLGTLLLTSNGEEGTLPVLGLTVSLVLGVAAVLFSLAHLTKPTRAYRALRRFPSSPLSREIAAYTLYLALGGLAWLVELVATTPAWLVALALPAGLLAIVTSAQTYLLPARPTWRHWSTVGTFIGCALSLGVATALLVGMVALDGLDEVSGAAAPRWLVMAGIALSAFSLAARVGYLRGATPDTQESWRVVTDHYAGLLWVRVLVGLVFAGVAVALSWSAATWLLAAWPALTVGELLDRRLFFASTVPLTFRAEIPGVR